MIGEKGFKKICENDFVQNQSTKQVFSLVLVINDIINKYLFGTQKDQHFS